MARIEGRAAIEYAEQHGLTLSKHADPTEDAREGLSVDEAIEVARQDPSLIYCERESNLIAAEGTDGWSVEDPSGGRWWPNDNAREQIRCAHDPAGEAARICRDEPMRGTWVD